MKRNFAVTLRAAELAGRVRDPLGAKVEATLEIVGHALPLPAGGLGARWREAVVTIWATCQRYREKLVSWRPEQGGLRWIVLQSED